MPRTQVSRFNSILEAAIGLIVVAIVGLLGTLSQICDIACMRADETPRM
jgi:hypothetical protein